MSVASHEGGPLPPTSEVRLLTSTPTPPPTSDALASAAGTDDAFDELGFFHGGITRGTLYFLPRELTRFPQIASLDKPSPDLRAEMKGPSGNQIQDSHDKISEKFEFMAHHKGVHQFCFTNKSPYHETIDFNVHVGHFAYYDQHAEDEHINPLLEQIGKLEEALYNIQFQQHWLEAQTEYQAIVNDIMTRRAVHKAFFESAALTGASVLQVYLLHHLFERKLDIYRV